MTRFRPHMAEIRRLIAEGSLGDIVTVTADHGQWFPRDPHSWLFDPNLGGGALLDLGVYPVSFASMILGPPDRIVAMIEPAFTGVDGQTSMLFGYANGAQAVLTCTSAARTPTRATIVGTDARVEIDGDFYASTSLTVIPRHGTPFRFAQPHRGRGFTARSRRGRTVPAGRTPRKPTHATRRKSLDHGNYGRGAGQVARH